MRSASALGSPSEVLPSILEVLEARIAPASATFIDVDGDSAVVKTTKGTDVALQAIVNASVGGDATMAHQMETLILSSLFAGTSLTVEVSNKAPQGDGLVNVWRLEATNMDLGSVVVKGDLASLQAGDTTYGNGSVKSVSVQSVGVNGGASMKGYDFLGGVSSISVAGDVSGAYMNFFNTDKGGKLTVGKLTIGGSLIGGANAGEGSVLLLAGDGTDPGVAEIKTVTIGGQLKAGAANKTGSILVGSTTAPAV